MLQYRAGLAKPNQPCGSIEKTILAMRRAIKPILKQHIILAIPVIHNRTEFAVPYSLQTCPRYMIIGS
jgi:hypothetical protein